MYRWLAPHARAPRVLAVVGVCILFGLWTLRILFARNRITRALVLPRTSKEDVSWALTYLPEYNVANYLVDVPDAPYHVRVNKAHEAAPYLTYLIDHYDKLADVTVFLHAHRIAWHNNPLQGSDVVQMLKDLKPEYILHRGYHNLRCPPQPGCIELQLNQTAQEPSDQVKSYIEAWKELFGSRPLPDQVGCPCCAQFAVSKSRIRSRPRLYYQNLLHWLMTTQQGDEFSGRVFEYLWHYIFGMDIIDCPDESDCYCNLYGICDPKPESNEDKLQW